MANKNKLQLQLGTDLGNTFFDLQIYSYIYATYQTVITMLITILANIKQAWSKVIEFEATRYLYQEWVVALHAARISSESISND